MEIHPIITDHSVLTSLAWSVAGHTVDTTLTITPGVDTTGLFIDNDHVSGTPHILLSNDADHTASIFISDTGIFRVTTSTEDISFRPTGHVGIGNGVNLLAETNLGSDIGASGANSFNNIYAGNNFYASSGAATAGDVSYSFTGDTDTGMYRAAADQLGFSTGGSVKLSIQDTATATVTIANNIDLNLTGISHVTSGSEGFIVGTTEITAGVFENADNGFSFNNENVATTGDLNVGTGGIILDVDNTYGTVGIGVAAAATSLLQVAVTRTVSDDFKLIFGQSVVTTDAADKSFAALKYDLTLNADVNVTAVDGVKARLLLTQTSDLTPAATITQAAACHSILNATKAGKADADDLTITAGYLFLADAVGAITDNVVITTLYGLYLPDITEGVTNWAIASAGGNSYHAGNFRIGSAVAPVNALDVTGVSTFGDGGTTNYSEFEADGTYEMNGAATVWNDMQFQISDAKVTPAALLPTWEAFTTNTSEYAFSVDDEVDTSANEIPHWWKEGTAGNAHMHITTKAINNVETTYAKFTVTFAYADTSEVWAEAPLTAELTIANPTAALTNLYLDLGDITLASNLMETQMRCRVARIDTTTGTEYVGDIFITQVGVHFEGDTLGSRAERTK